MLKQLARGARNAVRATGLNVPPGHFYSPVSNSADRARQVAVDAKESTSGVDVNEASQLALVGELRPHAANFAPKRWSEDDRNSMFGREDAIVLFGLLSLFRPRQIVEVGSGYSTAVMLDAAEATGSTWSITCIEPYPQRLNSLLRPGDDPEIIVAPVQDVPMGRFTDLGAGDLLFIDSTHVAKAGSDVLHLLLEVLPRLHPGVLVHVHDIFWPFSYRPEWLAEGRDWTEAYLLRALLTENPRWEILLFSDWLSRTHPAEAEALFPGGADRPGSIYLRRR